MALYPIHTARAICVRRNRKSIKGRRGEGGKKQRLQSRWEIQTRLFGGLWASMGAVWSEEWRRVCITPAENRDYCSGIYNSQLQNPFWDSRMITSSERLGEVAHFRFWVPLNRHAKTTKTIFTITFDSSNERTGEWSQLFLNDVDVWHWTMIWPPLFISPSPPAPHFRTEFLSKWKTMHAETFLGSRLSFRSPFLSFPICRRWGRESFKRLTFERGKILREGKTST